MGTKNNPKKSADSRLTIIVVAVSMIAIIIMVTATIIGMVGTVQAINADIAAALTSVDGELQRIERVAAIWENADSSGYSADYSFSVHQLAFAKIGEIADSAEKIAEGKKSAELVKIREILEQIKWTAVMGEKTCSLGKMPAGTTEKILALQKDALVRIKWLT